MSLKFKFLSQQLLSNQNIETATQLCFVYETVKCCKHEFSSHLLYKGSRLFITYFFTSFSLVEQEKVLGLVLLWRIDLIKEQGREGNFFRL